MKYKDFPQRLTWRGQDLVEPLLHLADLVGGDYPARARHALLHLFDDPAREQQDIAVELLRDLRDCFQFHGNPERLATAVFLEWLHGLPSRPWDLDGPITGRKFANLLAPFAVRPRFQRMGKKASARGYQLQDFVPLWQKHLGGSSRSEEPISTNKDAACSAVAHSGTTQNRVAQLSEAQNRNQCGAQSPSAASSAGTSALGAQGLSPVTASSQELKSNGQQSISPNKDAGCSAVAHSGTTQNRVAQPPSAVEFSTKNSDGAKESAAKASGVDGDEELEEASWLPPILMPSDSACYNYGPHYDWDVKIIRHFGAQGYKALSAMEAHRIEFSCGNLPFGTMAPRTSLQYPAKPVRTVKPKRAEPQAVKRAESPMTEAERAAAWERIRREREAPPKCAARENIRLAPQQRR